MRPSPALSTGTMPKARTDALTQVDYAVMTTSELRRRYRSAEDRSHRAETHVGWLVDNFAMQEIAAVLQSRGER